MIFWYVYLCYLVLCGRRPVLLRLKAKYGVVSDPFGLRVVVCQRGSGDNRPEEMLPILLLDF